MASFSRAFLLLGALLAGLAVGPPDGVAQSAATDSPDRVRPEASLNFTIGFPTGEFRDNIDDPGFGGSIYGGLQLGQSPVAIGLDLNFLVYGRSRQTVPFSQTVGPAVQVDVVTTNSIVQPHLTARLQPQDGTFRPYLAGLVGFKYLFTETEVRDDDRQDRDPIASTTNFDDFAFSGGAAAGVNIRLYRTAPEKTLRDVSLHLGVQYLYGQEAEYLAEGEIEDVNENGRIDDEELDIRRSQTTLIQPQIGVTVRF
jgi:hypothetical protein